MWVERLRESWLERLDLSDWGGKGPGATHTLSHTLYLGISLPEGANGQLLFFGRIRTAGRKCSEKERGACIHIHGYPVHEIPSQQGLSICTVLSHIRRILAYRITRTKVGTVKRSKDMFPVSGTQPCPHERAVLRTQQGQTSFFQHVMYFFHFPLKSHTPSYKSLLSLLDSNNMISPLL